MELLEQLRGRTLDAVHLELLRTAIERDRVTIEELEHANLNLTRRNSELQDRLERFERQAGRARLAVASEPLNARRS